MKDSNTIINDISELVKGMWGQSENPEGLRQTLNDIAVKYWALSNWLVEAEETELNEKASLELEEANLMLGFTDKGDAVNKAQIRTTIALGPKRKEFNKMKSNLNKIKTMSKAAEKAMDSLRTQLATIRGQVNG